MINTTTVVKTICMLLLCLTCHSLPAAVHFAPITVSGIVTDKATGDPVPGATVRVKGTSAGVTTNESGYYKIEAPGSESILIISITGYATQEIAVGTQTTINISLTTKASDLDEVVVIGYGTQRKGDVTSAVASVKSENFVKGFAKDAGQLIQGKVAGLAVTTPSGDPNANTQISLRGNSTLMSSTSPLVLIDGIPGSLNTVSPEDIESIDVLKDGSAAAIYGTRGTNGVVLITTRKKGTRPATLSYDGYASIQTIARKMEFLNADDYRRLLAEGFFVPTANEKWNYGTTTDWLDEITRTPLSHTHNLTLQGGSAQTNYVASVNVRQWQGLFNRSENQQLIGRVDINHSMLDNKLKFNLNVIGRNRKFFAAPNYAYIYRQAIIRNPTDSVYTYDGKWREDPNGYNYDNPVRPIEEVDGESRATELRFNGNIIYSPLKDFNIKLLLSGSKTSELTGYFETYDHRASVINNRKGYGSRGAGHFMDNLLELTADYSKTFSGHKFTVLGGYSYQNVTREGFSAWNSDFPSELYTYNRLQSGDAISNPFATTGMRGVSSYKNNYKLIGFFGRLNYAWEDKYLLMATLRHEGSSKFGLNYKWGTFTAFSAGWRISQEGFLAGSDVVNDLKIRAGYGITGTAPNDPYMSLIVLNYNSDSRFLYNGTWIQPLEPNRNPNPDLRWEKKEEINVGVDFSLWNSRISGSVDVYQRDTKDMLYDFPVPVPPNLFGSTLANAGRMRNRGVEVLLNYEIIRSKDFSLSSNITYMNNKNTLISISNDLYKTSNDFFYAGHTGEPIQLTTHRVKVGDPIGNFYGYKSIDIDDNGQWIIEGQDGKPKPIDDAVPDDRKVLGNGIARHTAGWNLSFRYKRFSLGVNMRGAFGYQILNFQRMYYENPTIKQYNMLKTAFDKVYGKRQLNNPLAYVSHYIENGDHWKIDNVTLGYDLNVSRSKYFKSARVYVSGLNLLVLTGYKGIDPEISRLGLDAGNDSRDKYPTTRTFTVGTNITF